VIPIFVASAVATLSIAYISDKIKHRGGFAIIGFCITGTGLLILINQNAVSANTKYGALYLMSIGAYISMPLVWTMLANNVSGAYKTAFAVGVETSLGSVGGVISAWIFKGSEAPLYTSGYKINFGAVCIVGFLTLVLMGGFWLENRARDAGKRDHRLEAPDADNLGDDHPHFRFTY
jgi:sugar phosphate permease